MKLTGRILVSLLSIGMSAVLHMYLFSFGQTSIWMLMVTGVWITSSWYLGKYIDKLRFEIQIDSLTNVFNRKAAIGLYRSLTKRKPAGTHMVAIYFIDVDRFKLINDNYGHSVGDAVLRFVAACLQRIDRPGKAVVRWGGDEFVVMVPCKQSQEIAIIYEEIQSSIKSVTRGLQAPIPLTITVGMSVYPCQGKKLEDLVQISDKQLIWNKRQKQGDLKDVSTTYKSTAKMRRA
ncbi:GGDEF domain-containing protein [Paenibacillus sp. ACRRX]|uniref:GGDEF domain-containing protein n=1 Tax=Paenibacillus sp. ACRRX TaxID=2918206 RepID=UPI001EF57616|nr:GGDEF domain-containing protein [Paenibacillus sp. ACRRX]MCG7406854.1 GGDEF domain-containing protein [Paenibacillus sp. ACRRX]